MPLLTPSQVHIDAPLTNLTLAYAQSQENFISDEVFLRLSISQRQIGEWHQYAPAMGSAKAFVIPLP